MPTIIATGTVRPSATPSSSASFTSPIPIPAGYASAAMNRKSAAPKPAAAHSTDGWSIVLAASTTTVAGSTILFGMMCRSASTAEIATSTAQKKEATAASQLSPKRSTHAAMRAAVVPSTSGYRQGIGAAQWRHFERSSANESSGTLSYHASGVAHAMQAEPGLTSERRRGTRAATTLRKLPNARPGTSAIAATVTPTSEPPAVPERDRVVQRETLHGVRG